MSIVAFTMCTCDYMLEKFLRGIISADDSPGAHDARGSPSSLISWWPMVLIFPTHPDSRTLEDRVRFGLKWMNARSQSLWGRPFFEGTAGEQTKLLECLAYKERFRSREQEGQKFFALMRDYTVKGHYTLRIGMEA